MDLILIVGGADTGRAPLVAGLLRRMLADRKVTAEVASAGVLAHDEAEMQTEARLALEHLGGLPEPHAGRSLTAELVQQAVLVLAVDRGSGRVVAARHPELRERLLVLPELANDRDVIDPFHMTLDKWVLFGRTFQSQLQAGLGRILRQIGAPEEPSAAGTRQGAETTRQAATPEARQQDAETTWQEQLQTTPQTGARPEAPARPKARLRNILVALEAAPEIVDWTRCRQALVEALAAIGAQAAPGDMAPAVVALLHSLLVQRAELATAGQVAWLGEVATALEQPIDAMEMARIAGEAARWAGI